MPEPNGILSSNLPGITIGDYSNPGPGPTFPAADDVWTADGQGGAEFEPASFGEPSLINLNRIPWGLAPGDDITSAIEQLIAEYGPGGSQGGANGQAIVAYLPQGGIYNINGAPQFGSTGQFSWCGQILLPQIASGAGGGWSFGIRGPVAQSIWGGGGALGSGLILQSNAAPVSLGTLSSPLTTSGSITTLACSALSQALGKGRVICLDDGAGHRQIWTTSNNAAQGATSITVVGQVPNFAYPAATTNVNIHPAMFAAPAAGTGGYPASTQVNTVFEDVSFSCPDGGSALDFFHGDSFQVERVIFSAPNFPGDGSCAVKFPTQGQGDWYLSRHAIIYGFGIGYAIQEVAKISGAFVIQQTDKGLLLNGGTHNEVEYLNAQCKEILTTVGGAGAVTSIIGNVLIQPGASNEMLINDPTGIITGDLKISYGSDLGADTHAGVPNIAGGASARTTQCNLGWITDRSWKGQHIKDTFHRIFAPASNVKAIPGLASHTLTPYRVNSGGFTIASNAISGTSSAADNVALWACVDGARGGRSRFIQGTFVAASATSFGVKAQQPYGSSNNIEAIAFGTSLILGIAGTNFSIASAIATGHTYVIRLIVAIGVNGQPIWARMLLGVDGGALAVKQNQWLTPAMQTSLAPNSLFPYVEDLLYFRQTDIVSTCTDLVGGDYTPTPETLEVAATATHTAFHEETTVCTSGTFTVTLPAPVQGAPANTIVNTGSGTITVAPPSGTLSNLSGATGNITLTQGQKAVILSPDGTNFQQIS